MRGIKVDRLTRRRLFIVAGAAWLAACGAPTRPGEGLVPLYANPARDQWPPELLELSREIQALYRYAAVNHATLQYIPCFCGCVDGGHSSNFDCYVRESYPDGRIRLDTMSFG